MKGTSVKRYLLVFRADYNDVLDVSPEVMQERTDQWMDWIGELYERKKLEEGGNHLSSDGKVIKSNGEILEGPFRENKESILGYILINAESYNEAVELAKTCPILEGEDTSVEIRQINSFPI